ncbi:MAG: hypothetical protein JW839_05200 [Candidatus Lokiarchaeota archaeon]|nr:hypothetical protein [Candidatus Lokiarchaeota archaeon]
MPIKATLSRLLARAFSLGDDGSTPGERKRRFVIRLAAWMVVVRVVLAVWVIVYPDSRAFNSIEALSIAPPVELYIDGAFTSMPANDSFFYWLIAIHGAGSWDPELSWRLVNFSQVFPAVLFVVKPAFSTWSPFVVNTAFSAATPLFLVSFLERVFKDQSTVRRTAIAVLFNPIFLAYSIFGLTEPLHLLLLFAALSAHYKSGIAWRVVENACLVVLVLNRFIGVILAVFYLYKALFTRGVSLKQRVLWFVPVAVMGASYVGWEWACFLVFGHTPSEARSYWWHHGFNLDPATPAFFVVQFPFLLVGVLLGVLVLLSAFSRNEGARNLEAAEFDRVEMQACVAMGAAFFLLIGLFNEPISVFRYTGTSFPLFAVLFVRVPTSKWLPVASFGVVIGVIVAHVVTALGMFATSPPVPSFTPLDAGLSLALAASFVVASCAFYVKRFHVKTDNGVMLVHLLLAILLAPLALYFP